MSRQRGRERNSMESAAGIVHPSPSAHMYTAPVRVRFRACRHDTDGCTVWVHRCTCASPGPRCGCMMYNRHRGLCSGEYANQYARPGSDFLLSPVPSPATRGSYRRNETVNTEGSRKSCACIYIRTFHSPCVAFTFILRRDSLTLLTCRSEKKNSPSTLA